MSEERNRRPRRPQKENRKQRRDRKMQEKADNSNARLSEFSDDGNDFYVDEVKENERARREEKREKKAQKKKKPMTPARRRLTRIISTTVIVGVILVGGVILSLTVLFKTQSYEVTGNTHYKEAEIVDTCGIQEGENIFLAPKGLAERRIKKNYPYVEEVKVSFRIPDTITIAIEEAVEGYLVKLNDSDEYLLVSTKGRILNRLKDIKGYNLPKFIGPKLNSGEIGDYVEAEESDVMKIIDEITTVFAENGYQGITEIDATKPANISFTYDNRIKVKLGLPEDLSYKIRTAMTIITENIDTSKNSKIKGTLDVSRCNETKRSYFNEQAQLEVGATEQPTGDATQENAADWFADQNGGSLLPTEAQSEEATEAPTEKPTKPLSQDDWYVN